MAKNYFNRYVWLIDIIYRRGHVSLQDISRSWERSSFNDDGRPMAERTFHNHREAILDMFGIEIKNDRSLGYYIDSEDMEGDAIKQWLLESLSMNNLVNEAGCLRDRILFEKIPSSQKWLSPIVGAMKDGKAIEMTYQSYTRTEPNTFNAHPYCLKLFKQRWYLLAKSEDYDYPRIYSLDRIHNIVELDKPAVLPEDFDAADYFARYFGIIISSDIPVETVELKVDADQVMYFRSLPLHPSQTETETNEEYSVFQYRLVPTFDFKQEILRNGPSVEVLSPANLREEVHADVKAMMKHYEQ
jgi:hypothetical protein